MRPSPAVNVYFSFSVYTQFCVRQTFLTVKVREVEWKINLKSRIYGRRWGDVGLAWSFFSSGGKWTTLEDYPIGRKKIAFAFML